MLVCLNIIANTIMLMLLVLLKETQTEFQVAVEHASNSSPSDVNVNINVFGPSDESYHVKECIPNFQGKFIPSICYRCQISRLY